MTSARSAASSVAGVRLWVAESTEGGICILALKDVPGRSGPVGPASGCTPLERLSHGASMELFGKDGQEIEVGAVPNGVSRVTANLAGGESKTVSVQDNAYAVASDSPISTVTFTGEAGEQTIEVGGNQ